MNLELLDPFGQHTPELVSETLSLGGATQCCQFNYKGHLLAAGDLSGECFVWDMETKSIARKLTGHVAGVNTVSWSRSGRYLLTASMDWKCILWDLKDGSRVRTIHFGSPVECAYLHPDKSNIFVAVLQSGSAFLIKLSENFKGPIHRFDFAESSLPDAISNVHLEKCRSACFEPTRGQVLIGTQKGHVVVLDIENFKIASVFRPCGSAIRGLKFDGKGRDLVINVIDKTIRVFTVRRERDGDDDNHDQAGHAGDGSGNLIFENEQRFQDSVNHFPWVQSFFSADGEFVIGGSDVKYAHRIYIWNRHVGNLVKVLDGEKDGLVDLAPHPFKPMLASVGMAGMVYIWTASYKQSYTSLVPDFQELDDNLEYIERESEFDELEDDDEANTLDSGGAAAATVPATTTGRPTKKPKLKDEDAEPDLEVDVCTIAPVNAFDDGVPAFVLPINIDLLPDPQDDGSGNAESPWQWHIAV
ncbi:WD40-repeat-containing domain protein [Geranomyces variabilis]|nr:WD40-repeat-containing domain protein [Geranomyces variabilis]KAJ3138083.1 chromatin binding protein [Geranomyces variabilis]